MGERIEGEASAVATTLAEIMPTANAMNPCAASLHAQAPTPIRPRAARDRLEEALARIADPNGEGARTCPTVYADAARSAADAADARARSGISLGPLDGTIVSLKDWFDVAGEPTRAGSKILADATPADADAVVVRRLRAAGCVIVAKTSMPEFAFSGLGLNPHYGTPGNPADRSRIPGGSSSGAAVAVADNMCEIAIGSDAGGSARIPAALSGVVGFKPSKRRIPTEGMFPLSYALDSVGPLARSVADCTKADAVMADEEAQLLAPPPLDGLRIAVPEGLLMRDLDATVTARISDAFSALERGGVHLTREHFPGLDSMTYFNAGFTIVGSESYSIHRQRLATRGDEIDPYIRRLIEGGRDIPAAEYVAVMRERASMVRAMEARLSDLDALVMPTVAIVAPTILECRDPEVALARDLLVLRNTLIANFFDLCAISLPLPRREGLPVGLMLVARNGQDRRLLRIAAAVERLFAG
jgi:aspartyl-tRNA(Asn)/glutamyl-tRNA(Gln) amidotransferase subunit A